MNIQPLPMATYSKKHYWHSKVDPMKALYDHLAHEIRTEIDDVIIEACINGVPMMKDGTK